MAITNHLATVFRVPGQKFFGWLRSGMAITNDLPSVFCWVITQQKTLGKSLVIAIPLRNQPKNFWPGTRKTVAKWLVIAIRLCYQKALHSHSAKSPKYGDISRWLTIAKSLVI